MGEEEAAQRAREGVGVDLPAMYPLEWRGGRVPRYWGGRVGYAAGGQLGQSGLDNSFAQVPQGQGMTGMGPGGQGLGGAAVASQAAGGFGDLFGGPRPGFQSGGTSPYQLPSESLWSLVDPHPLQTSGKGPPQPAEAYKQPSGQQNPLSGLPDATKSLANLFKKPSSQQSGSSSASPASSTSQGYGLPSDFTQQALQSFNDPIWQTATATGDSMLSDAGYADGGWV